ncbi:uncharacterized protein CC84DRAFT_1161920 [Paraphaeosphaeria sporulosa]|uniref:P-loop containing nucleoside triphosphate hydrolase protein n=1 Tax=Paraphaeosphaeria sporulosa TaxID=1460663 RepID=A0A177CK48_9PLEO|nr:uncharacterized protein CC84DRAFT_1161920 [Paraphaeosphaeria sporulosa]OAG07863.1 hypothetical protein CC84DRAFT_1161920 [Paraphaeosphaeria sporulosa]
MQSMLNRMFHRDSLPENMPSISIMGLDSSGITTILKKLACTPITTMAPTIGLTIETANIKIETPTQGGKTKRLGLTAWATDVGGCSRLYPLVQKIMIDHAAPSGVVWVLDASDSDRLMESREELARHLQALEKRDASRGKGLPISILLTKTDLPNRQSLETVRAQLDNVLDGRMVAWFETCPTAPLPSSGLPEAFAWLGDAIAPPPAETPSSAKPTLPETEKAIGTKLADMRSPSALAAKLDDWLRRAEKDGPAEDLLQQFYARDLPSWDHYTHLRLAYVLLLKHGRREGKNKIFTGFRSYIDHNGNTSGKSFHTTMTYFWVQMVHLGIACMDTHARTRNAHSLKSEGHGAGLDDFAAFLTVNQYLVDGQLWADYYSKEVLMSQEAREGVVFPDIKGLPDVVASAPSNYVTKAIPLESVSVSSTTALV